jgi:membrane-associated phospholipid phosphatase
LQEATAPIYVNEAVSRITFARFISIIGHPFVFVVLLLLLPFILRGQHSALRVTAIVIVAALIPLGLFMRQRYTSGRWQTVDASARADRPAAYLAGFAALLPMGLYFQLFEHSSILFRGCVTIAAMFAVAFALNRWIKLSGHLAFAGFTALILGDILWTYAIPLILFIPVLAWSRLALQRHTLKEVLGGLALGIIAASVFILLPFLT